MRPCRTLRVALIGVALSFPAFATLVDARDSDVRFFATGPAHLKINGRASDLEASESEGKLTLRVPVTDLKTGIKLRDRHLRKYLDASKYPEATLIVERDKLSFPADQQTAKASATGEFTLHGRTKPVKFTYEARRAGSDYQVQGAATIDIRDFDVEVPCYLGICVDPNVKLGVKFKLRET